MRCDACRNAFADKLQKNPKSKLPQHQRGHEQWKRHDPRPGRKQGAGGQEFAQMEHRIFVEQIDAEGTSGDGIHDPALEVKPAKQIEQADGQIQHHKGIAQVAAECMGEQPAQMTFQMEIGMQCVGRHVHDQTAGQKQCPSSEKERCGVVFVHIPAVMEFEPGGDHIDIAEPEDIREDRGVAGGLRKAHKDKEDHGTPEDHAVKMDAIEGRDPAVHDRDQKVHTDVRGDEPVPVAPQRSKQTIQFELPDIL